MSTPFYLLVLGKGFTEAWYQLSKGEQEELWAKVEDVERRAGSKWLILCDSRWADEGVRLGRARISRYGCLPTQVAELEKLNWWRYWSSSKTILGTKMDLPSP